jgi:hypothetical protein
MQSTARLIASSRSAPRDPSSRSGRRPVSIFFDDRQYRLWDGTEQHEMPPSRHTALASKDTNYRIKAIHQSFRPATARASARAMVMIRLYKTWVTSSNRLLAYIRYVQVEEIVGEDADDERNLFDSLDQDIDPQQLSALRERNKKRLDALEKKLKKLRKSSFCSPLEAVG